MFSLMLAQPTELLIKEKIQGTNIYPPTYLLSVCRSAHLSVSLTNSECKYLNSSPLNAAKNGWGSGQYLTYSCLHETKLLHRLVCSPNSSEMLNLTKKRQS